MINEEEDLEFLEGLDLKDLDTREDKLATILEALKTVLIPKKGTNGEKN